MTEMTEQETEQYWEKIFDEITDEHVMALDFHGWKIVSKDDPAWLWPFGGIEAERLEVECPEWCQDLRKPLPRPKPDLRVVRSPEPEREK